MPHEDDISHLDFPISDELHTGSPATGIMVALCIVLGAAFIVTGTYFVLRWVLSA